MYKGIILLVIVIALTMVYHKVKDSPSNKIKEGFECGDQDKILEGFQDIKDIRYGKLGGLISGCNSANKWIKIANVTVSGAWDSRGFTLEVYPRIRYNSSSRQTLICLMRNNGGTDLEEPYVSLTTHNEAAPNSRFIGDVRIVRTAGSGVNGNKLQVYVQFLEPCADSTYVMYYLWNFKVEDTVETTPQPMVDKPASGQAWGVNDRVDPRYIETSAGWVEKVVKNNGSNAYTLQGLWNNAGVRAHLFLNSNDRQADGGPNTATLRNDSGDLRVQSGGGNNIHLKPSGNVGIGTDNPTAKLEVNGDLKVNGKIMIGNMVLKNEGESLFIDKPDGRRIMQIDPDWDKIKVFQNSDGKAPYFYFNKGGDFSNYGSSTPNMRHGDKFTIRQSGGMNRLQSNYGWGGSSSVAQFNNSNRGGWEQVMMEKCGYGGLGDNQNCW